MLARAGPITFRKGYRSNGAYRLNQTSFDPAAIEARWKRRWAADQLDMAPEADGRPKHYVLEYFPYPSGSGLTVGHLRNYVPSDVLARYRRMQGYAVLHPMGWDAFGLPAENEARLHGRHPEDTTRAYAANYRRQLELVSCSYDWSRELFSSDPDYYRWTQWIFLLLFRKGLAYRAASRQWWCPTCATVLANEQVEIEASGGGRADAGGVVETDGGEPAATQTASIGVKARRGGPAEGRHAHHPDQASIAAPDQVVRCWRGHSGVTTREVMQWFLRITAYADRLLEGLDGLDWPDGILAQQRHWIGRTPGSAGEPPSYRLRDWSVGRQRFWGAPIPIVHCARCGEVPVPEDQLPVRLPAVDVVPPPGLDAEGRPTSPLVNIPGFAETTCPTCGGPARRETDTLDGFACSSWYFLRFTDPGYDKGPFDPAAVARWMPVDLYVGGAEHAVMHLLYARFWTMVLFDAGLVPTGEPFRRLLNQGMILDDTGAKMSKSRPDFVVTPDAAVAKHGADAVRAYLLFVAPFDQDVAWQPKAIAGVARWLGRVWRLGQVDPAERTGAESKRSSSGAESKAWSDPEAATDLRRLTHRAIREVTEALDGNRFNVVVARLMTFTRQLEGVAHEGGWDVEVASAWREAVDALLCLLAPIAPHLAEELWQAHHPGSASIHRQSWPTFDPELVEVATVEVAIQVDGKVRDRVVVPVGTAAGALEALALDRPAVAEHLRGRKVARVVVVAEHLVNVVTAVP